MYGMNAFVHGKILPLEKLVVNEKFHAADIFYTRMKIKNDVEFVSDFRTSAARRTLANKFQIVS